MVGRSGTYVAGYNGRPARRNEPETCQKSDILRDLLLLIGLAIPIVGLAHRFHTPPLVGFFAAGMIVGTVRPCTDRRS